MLAQGRRAPDVLSFSQLRSLDITLLTPTGSPELLTGIISDL